MKEKQNFFDKLDWLSARALGDLPFISALYFAEILPGRSLIGFFVIGILLCFFTGYFGYFLAIVLEKINVLFLFIFILIMFFLSIGFKILFSFLLLFSPYSSFFCKDIEIYVQGIMHLSKIFKDMNIKYYFLIYFISVLLFSSSFALGTLMSHDMTYFLAGIGMILNAIAQILINIFGIFKCKILKKQV